MRKPALETKVSHTKLQEGSTYDVAVIRIRAIDENGNLLPYYQEPLSIQIEGPVELIGEDVLSLKGGMGGLYIKTKGEKGIAKVRLGNKQCGIKEIEFEIA